MSARRKVISIAIAVIMVFGSLPVHFTDLGSPNHVYAAEESILSDAEIVNLDAAWLTADLVFAPNDYKKYEDEYVTYYYDIISNLNLQGEGQNGSTITWISSDESVIEPDGKVHRPTYFQGDREAILTATLTKGESTLEKVFIIVVSAIEPTPDEVAVKADYEWLVGESVIHYGVYANDIRAKVILPIAGENGSTITWNSSDERWIKTDGTVTQPPFSFAMGSAPVTLTAIIFKGGVRREKVFLLEVYPQSPVEADRVAYAMERLTGESILSGNSADSVKTRLNLPLETGTSYWRDMNIGNCQISWQSSNPDVIDVDGRVYRPAKGQDEVSVALTATITYGEESDTKTFDFLVTPIEEYPLAISYDGFSNTSLLQFNNISNTVDTKDRDGKDIKALQFNNDIVVGKSAGGSVFTKNKIRLDENLSFSTAFSYRNPHPDYALGEGGFTFTLQAVGNTAYSQQPNDESMEPSVSIAFITDYHQSSGSGQGSYYGYVEDVAVYYNGDYENCEIRDGYLTAGATNGPSTYNNVWIEYNGVAETLEIRFSTDGIRPANSKFKIENLNLAEIMMSADDGLGIEDVREVYAGFMGSMGNGKDKSEIGSWYLKSDFTPIDFEAYNFVDLSNVKLTANPPSGSGSSAITALVGSLGGEPVEGIPVDFTTSFGILNSSSGTTDASGNASVILRSDVTGTASVKVSVPGGATASIEVPLAVSDKDRFDFDCAWLTEGKVLGENTSPSNVTVKLELPVEAPNGSIISWESDVPGVIALDGTVIRPTFTEQNKKVRLTATINKGDYREIRIFDVIVKALDATD
ncbi:MAG: immunoglobulin-like domain-containing protein, partial [Anaerovoracaceae bacterium]